MNCFRSVSRFFLFLFVLTLGSVPAFVSAQTESLLTERISEIGNERLRTTLQNSVELGIIENEHDLNLAIIHAQKSSLDNLALYNSASVDRNTAEIRRIILELTAPFPQIDRDAIKVEKSGAFLAHPTKRYLFNCIEEEIPASYIDAYNLCLKFNPVHATDDAPALDAEIDEFLASIEKDPVIQRALKGTGTTMKDLKRNWFGAGLGFEHIISGEIRGRKVGGYHWWYRFYVDERNGLAQVKQSIYDVGCPYAFTGSFHWDPDGSEGPLPKTYKPLGGFLIGNSVQSLLALGHIAVETARKFGSVPQGMTFNANLNGEEFTWQLYTTDGTIRTLFPRGNKRIVFGHEYVGMDYN